MNTDTRFDTGFDHNFPRKFFPVEESKFGLVFISLWPSCQVHPVNCPLPLDAYLDHAWSTAGLLGAVPWMADFLRMMKWDEISAQVMAIL